MQKSSYNTHLFGDAASFLRDIPFIDSPATFADCVRANLIAAKLREERGHGVDVVVLQEVWDEGLVPLLRDGTSGAFPHQWWSNHRNEVTDVIGAGLMILSAHPFVEEPVLEHFDDEAGFTSEDAWASKGFVRTLIQKDGFQVGIVTTHLQAGRGQLSVRRLQLIQIGEALRQFQEENPSAEIVLAGDFNVTGNRIDDGECQDVPQDDAYYDALLHALSSESISGSLDMRDALRNSSCFWEKCPTTNSQDNTFKQMFQIETTEGGSLIDHVFYTNGNAYALRPYQADVWKPQVSPPLFGRPHFGSGLFLALRWASLCLSLDGPEVCVQNCACDDRCGVRTQTCVSSGEPCVFCDAARVSACEPVGSAIDLSDHYGSKIEFDLTRD